MSKLPPHKLDPHQVIRDPTALPKLVQLGIHDMILAEQGSGLPSADDMIRAYNIICWSLLTAGPDRDGTDARLRVDPKDQSRVVLTRRGEDVEREKLHPPAPTSKQRGRSQREPAFARKAAVLQRWATRVFKQDPARYQLNWWKAEHRA